MLNVKAKIKWISIVLFVIAFILNFKVGCPGDMNKLLKTMFHEDFPANYEITRKSETSLYKYLLRDVKCSYEIKISVKTHDMLNNNLKGTKFWRNLHPEWNKKPCPYLSGKPCDENELQNIVKMEGDGLLCYANFRPSSLNLSLECYNY